jgi:hypothetical protein
MPGGHHFDILLQQGEEEGTVHGWPLQFVVTDPRNFVRELGAYCDQRRDWRVFSSGSKAEHSYVAIEHLRKVSCNGRRGIVVFADPEGETSVSLTVHGTDDDAEYQRIEAAASALIREFAKSTSIRIRLARPRSSGAKMTRGAREKYKRFISHTRDPWTSKMPHALHPLDYPYFFWFIRHCAWCKSKLSPDEVMKHLRRDGFSAEQVLELGRYYHIGREVLAGQWRPWSVRHDKTHQKSE